MQTTFEKQLPLETKPVNAARQWIWMGFLIGLLIVGAYAIVTRAVEGLAVTNLSSTTPWGAWIAFYIFFVGLSAGAFLLSTMIYVFGMKNLEKIGREALLTAFLSMILALTFVLLDIGQMGRFWHALVYFNPTSILAYEVRFYTIYMLLLLVELYFAMRPDLVRTAQADNGIRSTIARLASLGSRDLSEAAMERDHKWLKVLGIVGIPIAIFGVHGGTGALFAVVKAHHYWNSAVFPIIFVVSALVSGTALLMALYIIRQKVIGKKPDISMVQGLATIMVGFLMVDWGLQFYEILISVYSRNPHALETFEIMFFGPMWWTFWIVQLLLGAIVPIFLFFKYKHSVKAMLAAAVMVVVGILAVRFNIVVPTQLIPPFESMPGSYYMPNALEIMASAGVISLGLLLYTLGVKYLPVDMSKEQLELLERGE